jgi:hypothetical protein
VDWQGKNEVYMAAQSSVDLTTVLLLPAAYTKPWAINVGRSSPHSPVFPGIL